MDIHFIESGFLKLDGGAMFGVVPKRMWEKLNPPDDLNMCTWSMRCLLVQTQDRNILIDTGVGQKQDARFHSHFEPWGQGPWDLSLAPYGLKASDITDVLLTHLHFDHVGGAIALNAKGEPEPAFPNAKYWVNPRHWDWACQPNPREAASFLAENFKPLKDWGLLEFIDPGTEDLTWLPSIQLRCVYGHTEAMMLPILQKESQTWVYCADLIPSAWHIGLPYVMAYDLRPLDTMREKERLLNEAVDGDYTLIFEHDPKTAAGKVKRDDKGRIFLMG